MKHLVKFIFVLGLLFLHSCAIDNHDVYGTWYSTDSGDSKIAIGRDNEFTHSLNDFLVLDRVPYEIKSDQDGHFDVQLLESENARRYNFYFLNPSCAIVTTYKNHIHPLMIDELGVLKKSIKEVCEIELPQKERYVIPRNFEGYFYVIYSENTHDDEVKIENNGIARNGLAEELHLFNCNREFRFENADQNIQVVNPRRYGLLGIDKNELISLSETDIVIVQYGYNQSGRDGWNYDNKMNVSNSINIEYFEIINVEKLKEKYKL